MGKLIRRCLGAAFVMILLGLGLALGVNAVKGTEYMNDLLRRMTGGRIDGWMGSLESGISKGEELLHQGISQGEDFLEEHPMDGETGYEIEENVIFDEDRETMIGDAEREFAAEGIRELELEIGGCSFVLQSSEDDRIHVKAENVGRFQAYTDQESFCVKAIQGEVLGIGHGRQRCQVTLFLPENLSLEEVNLELGAGTFDAQRLEASKIELEVGAGALEIEELAADELFAEVGAGKMLLNQMEISGESNFSVGMGHFEGEGTLGGDVNGECAMGSLALVLDGDVSDYDYDMECAAGTIYLDGKKYSGLALEQEIHHSPEHHDEKDAYDAEHHASGKRMDLECSMGEIRVEFK